MTGPDEAKYEMAPNAARKSFLSFYSNLGKVFQLPEFEAKLFF